jgi:hypothetical protein
MKKISSFIVGVLALVSMLAAASSATAATVTLSPAGAISAASSGLVSLTDGATAVQSAVRLAGSIRAGPYTGTLPITADIGSITSGTAVSSTPGFTTSVSFVPAWNISGTVTSATNSTLTIRGVRFLISNGGGIQCAYVVNVTGSYTNGSGVLAITSTTAVSETPLAPGSCPIGSPGLRGTFNITPRISWTLV